MFSFSTPSVWEKIQNIEKYCEEAMKLTSPGFAPEELARDIEVLHPKFHPPKKGFSTPEGQARMLHDLANIELQAMELGIRTLVEFPRLRWVFAKN